MGEPLGKLDGFADIVGNDEGFADGTPLGPVDGCRLELGESLGIMDGLAVTVGPDEGLSVGAPVGLADGC